MPKTKPQLCKRWAIYRPDGALWGPPTFFARAEARRYAVMLSRGRRRNDRYAVRRVTITPEE